MGTHYKGTKEEINALNSYIKLLRAAESISSRINSNLSKEGLTESQFNILDVLYHIGPMHQKDLGDKLLKSGGNITMVVDNLEKQELVKRERGKDRRYFSIHLTEKGRELIERIFPKQLELIFKEMNVLNEEEHENLQRICKKIGLKENEKQVA